MPFVAHSDGSKTWIPTSAAAPPTTSQRSPVAQRMTSAIMPTSQPTYSGGVLSNMEAERNRAGRMADWTQSFSLPRNMQEQVRSQIASNPGGTGYSQRAMDTYRSTFSNPDHVYDDPRRSQVVTNYLSQQGAPRLTADEAWRQGDNRKQALQVLAKRQAQGQQAGLYGMAGVGVGTVNGRQMAVPNAGGADAYWRSLATLGANPAQPVTVGEVGQRMQSALAQAPVADLRKAAMAGNPLAAAVLPGAQAAETKRQNEINTVRYVQPAQIKAQGIQTVQELKNLGYDAKNATAIQVAQIKAQADQYAAQLRANGVDQQTQARLVAAYQSANNTRIANGMDPISVGEFLSDSHQIAPNHQAGVPSQQAPQPGIMDRLGQFLGIGQPQAAAPVPAAPAVPAAVPAPQPAPVPAYNPPPGVPTPTPQPAPQVVQRMPDGRFSHPPGMQADEVAAWNQADAETQRAYLQSLGYHL